MLHHMVVFACEADSEERLQRRPYSVPESCSMAPEECPSTAFIWAFGQGPRCFGSNHGYPMGKNFFKKALLQLHYNNPSLKSGVRDSSGIRLYYTTRGREFDNSVFSVGQIDIAVPPKTKAKVSARTFINEECSRDVFLPATRYRLSSMLFHMHQTGVYAKLLIEKANGNVVTIVDKSVTYDRPVMITWNHTDAPFLERGDNVLIGK